MNNHPTFHIGNYRRVGPNQQIPTAPITIILGNNSSGKSALLSAVQDVATVYRSLSANIFDDNPNVQGQSFSSVCRGNDVERGVQLGFVDVDGFGFTLSLASIEGIGLAPKEIDIYAQHEKVLNFEYAYHEHAETDNPLGILEDHVPDRITTPLHYLKCNPNIESIRRLFDKKDSFDFGSLSSRLDGFLLLNRSLSKGLNREKFLNELGKLEHLNFGIQLMDEAFVVNDPHFFFVWTREERVSYQIDGKGYYDLHFQRLGDVCDPDWILPLIYRVCVEGLNIQHVRQLPELRIRPSGYVDPSYPYADEWKSGGGEFYKLLRQSLDVRVAVNSWFKAADSTMRSYEFRVVDLVDRTQSINSTTLNKILSSTGTIESDLSHSVERRLKLWDDASGMYVGLDEVGTGISQVTPVLSMLYGCDNSLLQIEQPELHLHPKLQSRLADAMIDSTARGNTVMVETHSEHLILRLLSLVRSGKMIQSLGRPLNPADLQIIFVEGNGSQSRVIPIDVTPSGNLSRPWPNGFFDDSLDLED